MNETLYFIVTEPPMPLAGQIPTCWGPVTEDRLDDFVEGFHIPSKYVIKGTDGSVQKFQIDLDKKLIREEAK